MDDGSCEDKRYQVPSLNHSALTPDVSIIYYFCVF